MDARRRDQLVGWVAAEIEARGGAANLGGHVPDRDRGQELSEPWVAEADVDSPELKQFANLR